MAAADWAGRQKEDEQDIQQAQQEGGKEAGEHGKHGKHGSTGLAAKVRALATTPAPAGLGHQRSTARLPFPNSDCHGPRLVALVNVAFSPNPSETVKVFCSALLCAALLVCLVPSLRPPRPRRRLLVVQSKVHLKHLSDLPIHLSLALSLTNFIHPILPPPAQLSHNLLACLPTSSFNNPIFFLPSIASTPAVQARHHPQPSLSQINNNPRCATSSGITSHHTARILRPLRAPSPISTRLTRHRSEIEQLS
ncbi:hypothetical protein V8E51_003518 [Hyaloscypha variabilis]